MQRRLNYFVGLRLHQPDFQSAVQSIQCEIVSRDGNVKQTMISPNKIHITLLLASLEEAELQIAKQCVQQSQEELDHLFASPALRKMDFEGLSVFGNRVLWLKPLENDVHNAIKSYITHLAARFEANNLYHQSADTLHATIAKVGRQKPKTPKIKLMHSHYDGLDEHIIDIGCTLGDIDLMRIGSTDTSNGYYQSAQKVKIWGQSSSQSQHVNMEYDVILNAILNQSSSSSSLASSSSSSSSSSSLLSTVAASVSNKEAERTSGSGHNGDGSKTGISTTIKTPRMPALDDRSGVCEGRAPRNDRVNTASSGMKIDSHSDGMGRDMQGSHQETLTHRTDSNGMQKGIKEGAQRKHRKR
jgi:2'-5' RNA ligase